MKFETIREIPRHSRIRPKDKAESLEVSQIILNWASSQKDDVVRLRNGNFGMLSKGHAAYKGANLIIDELTDDPINGTAETIDRPASYAFYDDEILCIEGFMCTPIEQTPIHEVGVAELRSLILILGIGAST